MSKHYYDLWTLWTLTYHVNNIKFFKNIDYDAQKAKKLCFSTNFTISITWVLQHSSGGTEHLPEGICVEKGDLFVNYFVYIKFSISAKLKMIDFRPK